MGRPGILIAALRLENDNRRLPAAPSVSPTIAGRDRAIVELWDLGWSVEDIADELSLGDHLIEQVVALFEDTEGSIS